MMQHDSAPKGFPPPLISRRGLLGAGGATMAALALGEIPARGTSDGTVLPLVAPLPGPPDRTSFAPEEQVFARYLMILAPLANSVVDDRPQEYGWMEDGWWRTPNDPVNSRIMEHVATLAWFLTHDRTWNPYYLDANLRGRLDAAIGYYLGLQGPSGAWPVTYQAKSLATTGFGLVALASTYRDLDREGLLPARVTQIETAMRAAAAWLLDTGEFHWNLPVKYTNQIVGALAGVGHAAEALADPAIASTLDDRIELLADHGRAPAGYFHDPLAFDHSYNATVMLPDLADLYLLTGNPALVQMVEDWMDFGQYVLLREPGTTSFATFAAASARNFGVSRDDTPNDDDDRSALSRVFVPEVPMLAALHVSAEKKAQKRAAWAVASAPVQPLAKGETSPRLYMHVPAAPQNADRDERLAQLAAMRPVAEATFTEHREGTIDQRMLFVRRPGYYAAALDGVIEDRERTGTGLYWHPDAGVVVCSLNGYFDAWWTTFLDAPGLDSALTASSVTYHHGTDATGATIDPGDLAAVTGTFTSRSVSASGAVTTDTVHHHDGIDRIVTAGEPAQERIPLFVRDGDVLEFSDGTTAVRGQAVGPVTAQWFALTRGNYRFQFSWGTPLTAAIAVPGRSYFPGGSHELTRLTVDHPGTLTMEITTVDLTTLSGEVALVTSATVVESASGRYLEVHAVNLEEVEVDVRISGTGGTDTRTLAPGRGVRRRVRTGDPDAQATVIARPRPSTGRDRRVWVTRLRPASS
ncbi:hypothetical protein LQF12_01205 [Ruania suaedae]|uniref:hypothetical protein n=1 Tax=Ruania suaedae TaxID=2897774 RepID=UPI001E4D035E|nr:hypothetical protein [Ruania suaedae]UFU03260.1 hypothetical protein LQF12_01205 [Ruania suaedae]